MIANITPKEFNDLSDLIKPAILAYRNGRDAAKSMLTLMDCPYDSDTIERKAWMRGYRAVREEEAKVN
jgi:ribosome modulation factor